MYKLSDIIIIPITPERLLWAKESAKKLDEQNTGSNTQEGGKDKNIKGCLGQWAVHTYLENNKLEHTYSKPFVDKQFGDTFDIKFCEDTWDIKCRGWWYEPTFGNLRLLMTQKEQDKPKKCEFYIFTTVDRDFKNVYILGAKSYSKTWEYLEDLTEAEENIIRFPTAGVVISRSLTPLYQHIWKI
jgi:hypothetical protein